MTWEIIYSLLQKNTKSIYSAAKVLYSALCLSNIFSDIIEIILKMPIAKNIIIIFLITNL